MLPREKPHRRLVRPFFLRAAAALCLCVSGHGAASADALEQRASPALTGALGLNTVPGARMDPAGTLRAGAATLDPYMHGMVGFQLAPPLAVVLRQSAEVSNIQADPDRLYPGVDIKLRLLQEKGLRPAVALGWQSAIGHKRMAGEYLTFSKRYRDFDVTGGIGWGRFAGGGAFGNPLKIFGRHFDKTRAKDGEMPNEANDWFTGKHVGAFGGVEYFTPWDGWSLKLDWNPDDYSAERALSDFQAPSRWGVGVNYKPFGGADLGVAIQGTDKIMARLSLSGLLTGWRDQTRGDRPAPMMRRYRTGLALGGEMENAAARDRQILYNVKSDGTRASGTLPLRPQISAPRQIGRAAVHMANHAGPDIEDLELTPTYLGLRGTAVKIRRGDLERAVARKQGSAEEIWRNARFSGSPQSPAHDAARDPYKEYDPRRLSYTLDAQLSLAEEDSGTLYRTALLIGQRAPKFFGLIDSFAELRLNGKHNLEQLNDFRAPALAPIRSDADLFAARTLAVNRLFLAHTRTYRSDLHLALIGGYLEEMFAGAGGEILYRPFRSRLAVGAEGWATYKRDPYAPLNLGLIDQRQWSGHVNAWYDLPDWDVTLFAKAGRYLAADVGATLGLRKTFANGAALEGYTTITDLADPDIFGGATHAAHGVRLSLPLGGYKYAPQDSKIRLRAEPLGRDSGQYIDNPLPLYEATAPFTLRHMAEHWSDVTP